MSEEDPKPALPPAGWYPDPEIEGGQRFWDGQAWTEQRQRSAKQARAEKKARRQEEAKQKLEALKREREAAKAGMSMLPTTDDGVAEEVRKLKSRVKDALGQNLSEGESIQVVIRGAHGQAIAGTGTRAFVLKPGFMAGASFGAEVTSWSYRNLVGIQVHKGLVSGAVVIQGPGQVGQKTSYWGQGKDDPSKAPNAIPVTADWDQVKRNVARLQALIDAAHAPQPGTVQSGGGSVADELRKLAELHNSGVLSEEEFATAKRRLLGD